MSKILTLKEQADIRKKEILMTAKKQLQSGLTPSDQLHVLLPNHDQQIKPRNFHNALQVDKGLRGGVRSGKTNTLSAEAILLSYTNRPLTHLSTSPSYDNAVETVIPELLSLCDENNLTYDWTVSNGHFLIIWGDKKEDIAKILVTGSDQPKFIKGITAASGDMNEPFSQKKEAFNIWYERISHPKARRRVRCWGGTAEPEKMQWGHEYYEPKFKTTKKMYIDTITTYDNKFLSKQYIAELEARYDSTMKEVYMMGGCVNLLQGKAYYNFDEDANVVSFKEVFARCKAAEQRFVVISYDFNIDPMTASEHWIERNSIHQLDEYSINRSNTRELTQLIINRIIQRHDLKTTMFIITGDASGQHGDTRSQERFMNDYYYIKQELDKYPEIKYVFDVPDLNPFVYDRIQNSNNEFEKKTADVCDNCTKTIEDRNKLKWKVGGEKFFIDKSDKKATHYSENADYAIYNTIKLRNKIFLPDGREAASESYVVSRPSRH